MKKNIYLFLLFSIFANGNVLADEGRKKLSQLDFDRKGAASETPAPTPADPATQLIEAITNESQIKQKSTPENSEATEIAPSEQNGTSKKKKGPFAPIE